MEINFLSFILVLRNTLPIHVRFVRWMKHLNLFKKIDDRSEDSIKQQRIITRVYLVLLIGKVVIAAIFITRK